MTLHRLVVLPIAAALVLTPVLASPAFAAHSSHHTSTHARAASVRPVPFTAVGTLTAVDPVAGTVTVSVRGGTRDLRGHSAVATVAPNARIRLGDARSTLAALPAGTAVTVVGTRSGGVLTATRVLARPAS